MCSTLQAPLPNVAVEIKGGRRETRGRATGFLYLTLSPFETLGSSQNPLEISVLVGEK